LEKYYFIHKANIYSATSATEKKYERKMEEALENEKNKVFSILFLLFYIFFKKALDEICILDQKIENLNKIKSDLCLNIHSIF
jgi:hypothetical protein